MKKNKTSKQKAAVPKDLYAAVDLHSNNGLYCVLDARDQVVFKKRLPNDLKIVLPALEPYRLRLVHGMAVESTFNWYWLADGLQAQGYQVQLVNTNKVQMYDGLKHANDDSDAFHLAHLQRLGVLPCGYILPPEHRAVRDLLRRRMLLVQQRTTQMLSFKSLVERQTGQHITGNEIKALEPEAVSEWLQGETVELMGQTNVRLVGCFAEEIQHLEKAALAYAPNLPDFNRLLDIPGIGKILNLVIRMESGPMERFAQAGNYVSYCRAVKAEKLSNQKKKGVNNRKCGNRYLSWAYVEAAHFAIRYSAEVRNWYQRKLRRCGGKSVIAIKAVAAKLAKAAYYMLKNQEPFKVNQVFC